MPSFREYSLGGSGDLYRIWMNVDPDDIRRLSVAAKRFDMKLNSRLATVFNRSARAAVKKSVDEVYSELYLSKSIIKNGTKGARRKKQILQTVKANRSRLKARMTVNYDVRLGLEAYGARHNKTGTSYRISRKAGRKMIKGAFMGPNPRKKAPRLYGGVFIRDPYPQTPRLPIVKKRGPSVWGSYVKKGKRPIVVRWLEKEVTKQTNLMIYKMCQQWNAARV